MPSKKTGLVLGLLAGISLAFPVSESVSFFSTSLINKPEEVNFLRYTTTGFSAKTLSPRHRAGRSSVTSGTGSSDIEGVYTSTDPAEASSGAGTISCINGIAEILGYKTLHRCAFAPHQGKGDRHAVDVPVS